MRIAKLSLLFLTFLCCSLSLIGSQPPPQSLNIMVDPCHLPADPTPAAQTVTPGQQRIYDHVRVRRRRKCCSICSIGPLFLFASLASAAVYFLTKKPIAETPAPSKPITCNNTQSNDSVTSCWQVIAQDCADCQSTEQSDIQCPLATNITRAQLTQKVKSELHPVCGDKAKICIADATQCPPLTTPCSRNSGPFKEYLNQKCKPKSQSRKSQMVNHYPKQKTHFKKRYR